MSCMPVIWHLKG